MPYKTKFREVEAPTTLDEHRAIGTDSNSVRSIGAATYRNIRKKHSTEEMQVVADAFLVAFEKIVEPYLKETGQLENLPHERRYQRWFMQGFQRAAEKRNDAAAAEYVSQKLAELQ